MPNYVDIIKDKNGNQYSIHAASDSITSSQIRANAVTSTKLASSAVTTSKIADEAITSAKLASDVIGMISNAGVESLNGFTGAISMAISGGTTSGFVKFTTGNEITASTKEFLVTGLDTAAYCSSAAFAPAYNYVKSINGTTPDASGNVVIQTGGASCYDLHYGDDLTSADITAIYGGALIRVEDSTATTYPKYGALNYARIQGTSASPSLSLSFTAVYNTSQFKQWEVKYTSAGTTTWSVTTVNLNDKANLDSPDFTGTPMAPTASVYENSDQIATTAFVHAVNASATVWADNVIFMDSSITPSNNVDAALKAIASSVSEANYSISSIDSALSRALPVKINYGGTVPAATFSEIFSGRPAYVNDSVGGQQYILANYKAYSSATATPSNLTFAHQVGENLHVLEYMADSSYGDNGWSEATVELATHTYVSQRFSSPAFTGTPTAPTASVATNNTQIATTAFVHSVVTSAYPTADEISYIPDDQSWAVQNVADALDSLNSSYRNLQASEIGFDERGEQFPQGTRTVQNAIDYTYSYAKTTTTSIQSSISTVKPLVLPYGLSFSFSTLQSAMFSNRIIVTEEQDPQGYQWESNYANLNWAYTYPDEYQLKFTTLNGSTVTQYTWDALSSSNNGWYSDTYNLATTAYITSAISTKANIASPTFTGTPKAPTATAGTSTTQIATTAFVQQAVPKSVVQGWALSGVSITSSYFTTMVQIPVFVPSKSSMYSALCYSAGSKIYPIAASSSWQHGYGCIQVLASGIYNVKAMVYCPGNTSVWTGVYIHHSSYSPDSTIDPETQGTNEIGGYMDLNSYSTRKFYEGTVKLNAGELVYMYGRCRNGSLTSTYSFGNGTLCVEEVNAGSVTWSAGSIPLIPIGGGDDPNPTI